MGLPAPALDRVRDVPTPSVPSDIIPKVGKKDNDKMHGWLTGYVAGMNMVALIEGAVHP